MIDIDEIDADRMLPKQHFARTWIGDRHILIYQGLRPPVGMHTNCERHEMGSLSDDLWI